MWTLAVRKMRGLASPELTGRARVEAEAPAAGVLATAAAGRNNGESRRLAARIRRIKYLLGDDSNHHDDKRERSRLSIDLIYLRIVNDMPRTHLAFALSMKEYPSLRVEKRRPRSSFPD
jgi:hypothetical protein